MTTTQSNPGSYVGIDDLTVDLTDGVLSVTLNRPDTLNSLTAAMLATIGSTLKQAATDPRVRVVRLAGAGRGFSSGAGISEADHANPGANGTPADVLAAANQAVRAIVELPKPVVGVVHGPAAGVGVSLALACDVIVASEKAYFLLAFTKIGLMPDGGASALVYPADELDAAVDGIIATLTSGPAVALRKSKQAINAATLTELDAAFARETEGQLELLVSNDFREGTQAFQQRRTPTFTDD
jgi:enoyl-CoA hydratase